MKNYQGMTILELVFVLGLLAIISIVLLPTYTKLVEKTHDNVAQHNIKQFEKSMSYLDAEKGYTVYARDAIHFPARENNALEKAIEADLVGMLGADCTQYYVAYMNYMDQPYYFKVTYFPNSKDSLDNAITSVNGKVVEEEPVTSDKLK